MNLADKDRSRIWIAQRRNVDLTGGPSELVFTSAEGLGEARFARRGSGKVGMRQAKPELHGVSPSAHNNNLNWQDGLGQRELHGFPES